jgi:hypothetical protein
MDDCSLETAARDYLNGERDWDSVNELAIQMEVDGFDFPPEVRRPMEELHLIFLTADLRDDPQFRADPGEISRLLDEVTMLRSDAKQLGVQVVAERQDLLEKEQEEKQRLNYLARRERRRRRQ